MTDNEIDWLAVVAVKPAPEFMGGREPKIMCPICKAFEMSRLWCEDQKAYVSARHYFWLCGVGKVKRYSRYDQVHDMEHQARIAAYGYDASSPDIKRREN